MEYIMENRSIFIENFLNKSRTALNDAEKNIELNMFFTAMNRLYYSIFYSVVALGYLDNYVTSKHKQLMGWFNSKYVYEEKIFNPELMKIYKEAFEDRMESDYEISSVLSKDEMIENFNKAKLFVTEITNYIKEKTSI